MKNFLISLFMLAGIFTNLNAYIMLDDFEQDNANLNSLYYNSDVYTGVGSVAVYLPDYTIAAKNGTRGAYIAYSNSSDVKYWNNFKDTGTIDLTTEDELHFWIRAVLTNTGYPRKPSIDYVILEGTNYTIYGRVPFSNYNGGSKKVSTNWTEISIPLTDFTNDKTAGFSLSEVHSFALKFTLDPGGGNYNLDNFEQNNGAQNSLGKWSGVYVYSNSSYDYQPDVGFAAKEGTNGLL